MNLKNDSGNNLSLIFAGFIAKGTQHFIPCFFVLFNPLH